MTTMIVELCDALKVAGAPEDKAQTAAAALAEHQRRFDHIDGELKAIHAEIRVVEGQIKALETQITVVKWVAGATSAGVFALIVKSFF